MEPPSSTVRYTPLSRGCFAVRSSGRTILIDTGYGPTLAGRLFDQLAAKGVNIDDIETVTFTHLHPDHVGWNMTRSEAGESVTFPNARYVANEADWDAFNTPRDEEIFGYSWWEETVAPLRRLGVLDMLTGETQLTSEITAIPTPGHTPGSMSLVIVSGGERALIMGDVFHNPAQVTETDWAFIFDYDPVLAIQTRGRMVERAEAENATMAICHSSGFGKVIRAEGRRYWQTI